MEQQLLEICNNTLNDFMKFIQRSSSANRFKLNVIVEEKQLVLAPPFVEFKKVLCEILDDVVEAVSDIERLETVMYVDWPGPPVFLKVHSAIN